MGKIKKEEIIYLDSTVFLNAILDTESLGENSRKLLEKVEEGEIKASTSVLSFDEIAWIVKKHRNYETSLVAVKDFLDISIKFIDVNYETICLSYDLMKKYKLRPRDAIHAASALSKNIKIIISEDDDFDDIKEIKRKSVMHF